MFFEAFAARRGDRDSVALSANLADAAKSAQQLARSLENARSVLGDGAIARGGGSAALLSQLTNGVVGSSRAIASGLTASFAPLGIALKGVGALAHGFTAVTDSVLRLGGATYVLERIGRAAQEFVVGPFERIVAATEKARGFQLSISGVVGGMDRAKTIDQALIASSRDRPQTVSELRDIGREMALIPSLSTRMALGSPRAAAADVGKFADLVGALATLDPVQGQRGALMAIREGASGDLVSLRRRLEIQPQLVASLIGKTPRDLSTDPALFLKGLQQYRELYVPDKAIAARGNMPSVLIEKIKDNFELAMQAIGEKGVFDRIAQRLRGGFELMFDYIQSPAFEMRAKSISDSLTRIFDSVVDALMHFLQQMSGAKTMEKTPDSIVGAIDGVLKKMADWAPNLIDAGKGIGKFFADLTWAIQEFVGSLSETMAVVKRDGVAGGILPRGYQEEFSDRIVTNRFAVDQFLGSDNRVGFAEGFRNLEYKDGFRGLPGQYTDPYLQRQLEEQTSGLREMNVFSGGSPVRAYSYRNDALKAVLTELEQQVTDAGLVANPKSGEFYNKAGFEKILKDGGFVQRIREAGLQGLDEDRQREYRRMWNGKAATAAIVPRQRTPAENITHSIDDILTDEESAKTFRTKFLPVMQSISKVGESWQDTADEFVKVYAGARGQLAHVLADIKLDPADAKEKPGSVFTKVENHWQEMRTRLDKAAGDLFFVIGNDPFNKDAHQRLRVIQAKRAELELVYQEQSLQVANTLADSVRNMEIGLSRTLEGSGTSYRSKMLSQIMGGELPEAQRVAKIIGRDPRSTFGLAGLPTFEQPMLVDQLTRYKLAEAEQAAQVGGSIRKGDSSEAIIARAYGGMPKASSLAFGRGSNMLTVDVYQQQVAMAQETFNRLRTTDLKNPDNARAFSAAADQVAVYAAKLHEAEVSTDRFFSGMIDWANKVQESLETALGSAIEKLITGTGNLSDVFKQLGRDIVASFSKMASQNIIQGLIGPADGTRSGGGGIMAMLLGAMGVGGPPAANTPASAGVAAQSMGSTIVSGVMSLFAADGAVFPGGFMPVGAYAGGGMISRPTIGIIGERHQPEAVVPMHGGSIPLGMSGGGVHAILPGGRRIPAAFFGDGGVVGGSAAFTGSPSMSSGGRPAASQPRVYVVANYEQALQRGYSKARGHLLVDMLHEARPGGKFRQALSRGR